MTQSLMLNNNNKKRMKQEMKTTSYNLKGKAKQNSKEHNEY